MSTWMLLHHFLLPSTLAAMLTLVTITVPGVARHKSEKRGDTHTSLGVVTNTVRAEALVVTKPVGSTPQ